jgi:iron complex transport system ATP-binding protein
VMHDLNLAAFADRIVVLAGGRVVRDAPPAAVIEQRLVAEIFGAGWRIAVEDGRPVIFPDLATALTASERIR